MLEFPTEASGSVDGKNFLRLRDGESVVAILRGKIHVFHQHWKAGKSSVCTETDDCADCQAGIKPKFRFRVNAIVKEGDHNVAKVWEQGWTVYESLLGYAKSGLDLEKIPLTITRRGSGQKDTSYVIVSMVKLELTTEQSDRVGALPLFDLATLDTPQAGVMATAKTHMSQHQMDVPF